MGPLVSIIIPVYNVANYLPKCVDSVLTQTYSNLEIILVDDGSTDVSASICDAYAKKDSRVTVLHKKNAGVAEARNSGLEVYSGEYMMYVDPDDYITESAVQVLLNRLLSDGSELAIGKHATVYSDASEDTSFCDWMRDAIITQQELLSQLGTERYYPVANCAKLYSRHILQGLRYPPLTCGEDVWMFPLIARRCKKVSIVNETVYYYFQRENSLVHSKTERSWLHDIEGVLHLVSHLCECEMWESARRWYLISVDKALKLKKISAAKPLFNKYLDATEEKRLQKGLSMKLWLKVRMLHMPWLYLPVRALKNRLRRK